MTTVAVIGASSGIGLACAVHLAHRGYHVFGTSRRPPPGQVPFEFVAMDVTSEASVEHALAVILARAGQLDAIVHSAGIGFAGAIEDTSVAEAQQQFDTNFFGAHRVLRAALPALRASRGRVIIISSIGGAIALPFQGIYCASKFALEGLGEALSHELHGSGIRVVLVQPGDFHTGFTDARTMVRASGDASIYQHQLERSLAVMIADERRGPDPRDVARVVEHALRVARPQLRYPVGMPLQRWSIVLKHLLPWRLFAAILRMIYKIRG
ncbi:MAG: SDR family oxidoreductase [Nannocystis sp.]|uniref:SDR family oxidoreductase n=1 Tax=Nannocystis sp. TaxID=1962667 RepID=UPI002426E0B7|nr:SDR family oxidoreductase [Nannocystis sp.]MBK9757974.1 SDR family oxidoreductase [Nannocystis sp.]